LTAFTRKHLESLVADLNLTVLPVSAEHSMLLFGLPTHHHDPFDRALIAIALAEGVPLVARDGELKKYKGLRTIW
jgi:PIN domain nuclease of toxin-antitoxin system